MGMPECAAGAAASTAHANVLGGPLAYRACAGTITLRDAFGKPIADLFYTAYFGQRDRADASPRPLAFIWNGGPGADSRQLQFEALGPRVLQGAKLVDNAASPLASADLVFLDPAGTGFSRAASPEAEKHLYGTVEDIAATAQFIEMFRKQYAREASPLYLLGESFGTWRASGTAEALLDAGVPVAGIGLISGGIPLGETNDRALDRALFLPGRTATAAALGKLDPELQADPKAAIEAAAHWARSTWYPALRDPSALDAATRAAIVAQLARFQGLKPGQIDANTLWTSPAAFRKGLLADEGKVLDVFDMRKMSAPFPTQGDAAVIAYYRQTLGYTGGAYAGIEVPALSVGSHWAYDQAPVTKQSLARAMAGEGPPSPARNWVGEDLAKSPHLRVFVAAGLYDSLNSCLGNEVTVAAMPPAAGARVLLHCYAGGHMMYEDPAVTNQFGEDVAGFLSNSR